jgi:hypothetical protein
MYQQTDSRIREDKADGDSVFVKEAPRRIQQAFGMGGNRESVEVCGDIASERLHIRITRRRVRLDGFLNDCPQRPVGIPAGDKELKNRALRMPVDATCRSSRSPSMYFIV